MKDKEHSAENIFSSVSQSQQEQDQNPGVVNTQYKACSALVL